METFLLRIIKGTGINGLTSIPIRRERIIRPLLRTYRSEIEAYVHRFSIPFIEDSSNRKETYERNFVRMHIVPPMARLNPRFREKVLLLLSDIASVDRLFDEEARRFLDGEGALVDAGGRVSVAGLRALHPEVRFRVVSRMLALLAPGFIALREHVLLVEKSLFSRKAQQQRDPPPRHKGAARLRYAHIHQERAGNARSWIPSRYDRARMAYRPSGSTWRSLFPG